MTTPPELNVFLAESPTLGSASLLPLSDSELALVFINDDAVYFTRSTNAGQTWSRANLLHRAPGANLAAPSLARTRSGRLIVIAAPGLVLHSDDFGQTWSAPRPLCDQPQRYRLHNDRLITLSTGRLLLPVQDIEDGSVGTLVSDDRGLTWRPSQDGMKPAEGGAAGPPVALELPGGAVAVMTRMPKPKLVYTFHSTDAGETWAVYDDWAPAAYPEFPFAARYAPGTSDLFMIWQNHSVATNLTTCAALDGGRFWDCFRSLESQEDWPVSYLYEDPTLTFAGSWAHITYVEAEQRTDGQRRLVYRRLPMSWLRVREPRRPLVHDVEGFLRGALSAKKVKDSQIRAVVTAGFNPAHIVTASQS